ncbi:probable SAM50 Sorting and Assembly Machinery (SAM) complex subunit [Phialocephala subalpina]|uniref:Probable SAM50 Sorting and Assembly Machinery (SAM) complex subunit n=1 Tax=Phialocephala subalpina TaxID=576137 RepID=A0A1L7XMS3_9HELO|nr:probable SAM50 Sorting and Assembly Machinery (SAM) complex subunit [Phialocephala subalpina]
MADGVDTGDELFESLRKQVDPKKLEEKVKALAEREAAQSAKAAQRLGELIGSNSSLPVTISSIRLIGAEHTRRSFLDRIFNPILSANKDKAYTLQEALQEVGSAADKLRRFEIYHPSLSTFIDRPDPTDPNSTPTDINVYIQAKERGRVSLKTGTDLGNVEGSAYGNLTWRNIFGGAESLNLNASAGTRTRSAYQATFDTPILSDPDKRATVDVLASSTLKPWSSHEEVLKGAGAKYSWATKSGTKHQVGYTGVWRQVTGLAANASPTVRTDAGDSVKSSISHTWFADRRNHPFLPSRGYFVKTVSEIAGWGPLQGDAAFWKSEFEASGAIPIPIPGKKGDSGVSLTGGLRGGMIYPLPIGFGSEVKPSRINDRFTLGGPTDVRGFKMSGLGPRDGPDAVGGDVYAAASANLLMPFPRVGKDTPLRLQLFANAGRLLALQDGKKSTSRSVYGTVAQLGEGIPSLAAGFGVVYAHPVARFELNFSLPLVLRKGEEGRKGLQFGVGINFL